jgi:hypothetical protein
MDALTPSMIWPYVNAADGLARTPAVMPLSAPHVTVRTTRSR